MSIKPILFNTEMVQATLDERKTATRRIVKSYIPTEAEFGYTAFTPPGCISCRGIFEDKFGEKFFKLPYQKGDIIYVRETWGRTYCYDCGMGYGGEAIVDFHGKLENTPFECDDKSAERIYFAKEKEYGCYCYKASAAEGEVPGSDGHWHPSIHMPREAARIFLKVTDVRVERLQDMRLKDCLAEGVLLTSAEIDDCIMAPIRARERFAAVWNDTVKPADLPLYGFDVNPWVWVIEFERIRKDEVRY